MYWTLLVRTYMHEGMLHTCSTTLCGKPLIVQCSQVGHAGEKSLKCSLPDPPPLSGLSRWYQMSEYNVIVITVAQLGLPVCEHIENVRVQRDCHHCLPTWASCIYVNTLKMCSHKKVNCVPIYVKSCTSLSSAAPRSSTIFGNWNVQEMPRKGCCFIQYNFIRKIAMTKLMTAPYEG